MPECAATTRRRFLATLGAGAAVTVAGSWGLSVWARDPAVAGLAPSAGAFAPVVFDRTLVVIEMGGGNDGFNTVVPHANPRYHDLRRELAIQDAIDLDGEVGLHPALETIAASYRAGDVAIVEGLGYENPDLSHFASMSTWWSGEPNGLGRTGWLGRYLDGSASADESLPAVTIGQGPTPALLGDRAFQVVVQDASGLTPSVPAWMDGTDELMAMWSGFAPPGLDRPGLAGVVDDAILGTVSAAGTINGILAGLIDGSETDRALRGRSQLATSLRVAARLVASQAAPRIVYIHGWGDFDTHESQANRHDALMEQLDVGIGAFFSDLAETGSQESAIVMTTSEFGRRVAYNGSGTDHGTASSHFVIGPAVAGGRYGEPVNLERLDPRGNVVHTVDYRTLYSSVVEQWLAGSGSDIIGAAVESLPIIGDDSTSTNPVGL